MTRQLTPLIVCLGLACARSALDKNFEDVRLAVLQADGSGAMRCAPRQLAVAQSHLDFARLELEQGSHSGAQHHLRIADEHARAALLLSPADSCAGRSNTSPSN